MKKLIIIPTLLLTGCVLPRYQGPSLPPPLYRPSVACENPPVDGTRVTWSGWSYQGFFGDYYLWTCVGDPDSPLKIGA